MIKKIINFTFLLTLIGTFFATGLSVSALTSDIKTETKMYKTPATVETTDEQIGVSTNKPSGIIPFGTSRPTNSHNLNNGKMEFSGGAANQDLYTNKFFYGKSNPKIVITATKWYNTTARVYTQSNQLVTTITVPVGNTKETTLLNVNTTTRFYIRFSAPCYFTGYVQ